MYNNFDIAGPSHGQWFGGESLAESESDSDDDMGSIRPPAEDESPR